MKNSKYLLTSDNYSLFLSFISVPCVKRSNWGCMWPVQVIRGHHIDFHPGDNGYGVATHIYYLRKVRTYGVIHYFSWLVYGVTDYLGALALRGHPLFAKLGYGAILYFEPVVIRGHCKFRGPEFPVARPRIPINFDRSLI